MIILKVRLAIPLFAILWSLIPRLSALLLTTLNADKIEAPGLLHQQQQQPLPSTRPRSDISYAVNREGDNDGITQREPVETAAGATMLLHQLIYELAVEHKHIPRLSLLTCQHGSPTRRRMRQQTRTSINIDMLTVLRTLFTGKDNRRRYSSKGYSNNASNARPDTGTDGVSSTSTNGFSSNDRHRFGQQVDLRVAASRSVLIKVLRIDLLINSRATRNESAAYRGRFGSAGLVTLEALLRSEVLRQFVVLDLSCGLASRKVIEMASNKGLFNSSYHWLLIEDYTFNRQPEDDYDDDVENDFHLAKHVGVASSNSKPVDNKVNKSRDDDRSNSHDYTDGNSLLIEKFLEKINININTELILAKRINGDQDSKEDYYLLYDVWSPGLQYGGELNITEIGKFSKDAGLQLYKWYRQTTTIVRRMDMRRARIRCMVVVTNKNFTGSLEGYLTHHIDTHLDSMNRFNFALISHVRDLLNFSMILSRTTSWGYLKNGKFDGMIGALVRRQADISGSPIFFRIERAKVIDYTTRTWVSRPCFIFRHPRTIRTNQIVFLQPFTNDVWVLVAICAGLTIFLLAVLTIIERKLNEISNKSLDHEVTGGGSKSNQLGAMGDRNRKRRRQIDSELSFLPRRGALSLVRDDILRDIGPRFIVDTDTNATTMAKVSHDNGVESVRKGGSVPPSYDSHERNAIDCIDDGGVGINDPTYRLFLANNDNDSRTKKTFKKILNVLCVAARGISLKQRLEMTLESLLFYVGSMCQQGLAFSTSFLSGRCIVLTSLLFSFCIYQFYSASIVGTLLMEKPKTIKTLRDLIHSSLEIGIEDIIYNREYFLRTRDPDAIELYAKKVTATTLYPTSQPSTNYTATIHSPEMGAHSKATEASNWYDPEYGVAKIKQGGFAFHVDVATAYKIIADTFTEKEVCDLSEIQLFAPQNTVSIVQKGSPLRKVITYGLRRTWEAGLMDYQRKVWHSAKPRCVKQIHTDDLRVDMQTFTSAVSVLIFGFAASIVALAMEKVHNNLWQHFAT